MQDDSIILINDTCILFDLIDLELLEHFFSLEFPFVAPQFVIDEIKDEKNRSIIQPYIDGSILQIDNDGDIETILNLSFQHTGLSITDCSVLESALRLNGILISGDKKLRTISKQMKVEVKGLLWIIELLRNYKKIDNSTAISKLNMYLKINPRAPKKEIGILAKKYQQTNFYDNNIILHTNRDCYRRYH